MNKCEECGCVFSNDEIAYWQEGRGEHFGFPCTETMSGCPRCKGGYTRLKACELCEQEVIEEDSGERYCEECKKETMERFAKLMLNNFSEIEIDLIAEVWEGDLNVR